MGKRSVFQNIAELLAILTLVMGIIQFLLFSLVGIEYDPEAGTGLVAIVEVSCCLYTMAFVLFKEMGGQAIHPEKWPYFLPVFIILEFFVEFTLCDDLTFSSFAGRQFIFWGVGGVPAIYLATYMYRYDRFDMITRNMDIIMVICTLALVLNVPNMFSTSIMNADTEIGGGGGHQTISYGAAFCFGINWVNILSNNIINRFSFATTRLYRYFSFVLLPIQAIICIMGGGRGGALLMVVTFALAIFLYSRKNFSKTMLWGLVAVIAFVVIATQSGQFSNGFGRAFDYLDSGGISTTANQSDIVREELRQKSYKIISDSPILGHGLWNGLVVAGFYMHNVFLDVLISGGIIYFVFVLVILKKTYFSIKNILNSDNAKCMLLPLVLYPSIALLFSGFYLKSPIMWFVVIYALLNRRNFIVY